MVPNRGLYCFFHYIKVNVSDSDVEYDVVKLPTPDFELINSLVHDAGICIYAFFALHFWGLIIILSLICLFRILLYFL